MSHDRSAVRAGPVIARRVPAAIQRSAAASSAEALRHRLGHQGAQALVQRKAAQDAATKATRIANVSSPHDPAELEAESTARNVVRMPQPVVVPVAVPVPVPVHPGASAQPIQRAAAAPLPAASPPSAIPGAGAGSPLPASVRDHMEPRFGANFGGVRVHTDGAAAEQSAQLGAHAFTVGHHVFFGRDKYQPDSAGGRELIAHELTHTIQQGAAAQHAPAVHREPDRAVVHRSADATVTQRTAPRIQRFGFDDAMNWIAEKANAVPGFRMLTLVLGVNPVNMAPVERSGANVLRAILELVPITGPLVEAALDNYGILAKVGAWMDVKVRSLGLVGAAIWQAVKDFAHSLGLSDLWSPGKTWDRAVRIFKDPIDRLIALGTSTISEILGFIREAILTPLAALAEGTKGYDLLKAVLGQDPVTGKPVARTPDALIGGFMKLIGEEEIWENVKKANAVARAWAWFQGALEGVMVFVRAVPKVFMDTLKSLEITDLLLPPKAFVKVAIAFGSFLGQFLSWAGNAMWTLLQLIFEVVSPTTLMYLKKTGAALKSIIKNPIPFMHHLLDAAKLGLQNFADNFGAHLKAALFDWLLGALPGVYIPKAFTLEEIVKFIFSVLGLSWANIRQKLVAVVGETAVKAMETGFDIVVTLVTKGPAAAWDKIKDELSNLKDQVISGIIDMVIDAIVKKAIPKLISMFIPGAGFISAIISIYDTIMVFVNKLARIVALVKSVVDSIVAIAEGQIDAAAKRVESALASVLSLLISVLAGLFGLGNIAEKVMGVINKIRGTVDKAIDALIAWIVKMAKALFAKGKAAVGAAVEWWKQKKPFKTKAGHDHEVTFEGEEKNAVAMVASNGKKPVKAKLGEFKAKASASDATTAQKKAGPLVDATEALVMKSPDDPNLTINLKQLFETYDEAGAPAEMKVAWQTGSLGGSTVGLSMTVDWLGPQGEGKGSPPASGGQAKLMDLLVTEPATTSTKKYVRGHLLNENLGGPGTDGNLFPITGYANSQHLHSTEKDIKTWVNKKGNYAFYEVKVQPVESVLKWGSKDPRNYVDAVFACHYILKEDDGTVNKEISTSIPSTYDDPAKTKATITPAPPPKK